MGKFAFVVLILAALCGSCGSQESESKALIERYRADLRAIEDFYSIDHGLMRLDRLDEFEREWLQRIEGAALDGMPRADQIDLLLLADHLRYSLDRRTERRTEIAEVAELTPFSDMIVGLEEARWRMAPLDPQAAAGQIADVKSQIDELTKRLREGKKEKPVKSEVDAGPTTQPEEPESDPNESDPDEGATPEERATPDEGAASEQDGVATAKAEETPQSTTPEDTAAPASTENLKPGVTQARRAARITDEIRRALESWFRFHDGYMPEFGWWVRSPYEQARGALEEYAKFLRKEIAGEGEGDDAPLIGDPIGREALVRDLLHERIPYTPEEILAIGRREAEWCAKEMAIAAKAMGHDDWRAALAVVKASHASPGEQAEMVARQARDAIAFVKERDLVTIEPLAEETWRLEMISKDGQRTMPFAAYSGQKMLVAYPTDAMAHEDKLMSMRGNNEHFSKIVTPHELIPGHHLQGYMADRYHTQRGIFRTAFLVEGWSLYWEMRLWEMDYATTPEDRIGMLFWRNHRAARIVVSLGFHLGEMTPAAMIDYLVENVGMERAGATSEVRRYIGGSYGPLYQAAYMIGGLQLRALHRELVANGSMSEREFHDAVLHQNSIPIDAIRQALGNQPIDLAAPPSWRFDTPE